MKRGIVKRHANIRKKEGVREEGAKDDALAVHDTVKGRDTPFLAGNIFRCRALCLHKSHR